MVINVDSLYLDDATQRITELINTATPDVQALRYIDKNLTPPFWWVYLGKLRLVQKSEEVSEQAYTVNIRYVLGFWTEGFSGEIQQSIFPSITAAHNTLFLNKNLIFGPYSSPPKYLEVGRVMIEAASTFGAFQDSTNQVGIEFGVTLPFKILLPSDKE